MRLVALQHRCPKCGYLATTRDPRTQANLAFTCPTHGPFLSFLAAGLEPRPR